MLTVDYLLTIFAMLVTLVPLFFLGGCPCCGNPFPCATKCIDGIAPDEVAITFAGIIDNAPVVGCEKIINGGNGCPSINSDTFIVPPNANCGWQSSFYSHCNPPLGAQSLLDVDLLDFGGGDIHLSVRHYMYGLTGGCNELWQSATLGTAPIDCMAIGTISLPHVSSSGTCGCISDGSAISATL